MLIDGILASMHASFEQLYSRTSRPSVPKRLLRTQSAAVLFSIRSERQLVQHIDYSLLYRQFVGPSMDESMWDATAFTKNRGRLLSEALMQEFFGKVRTLTQ